MLEQKIPEKLGLNVLADIEYQGHRRINHSTSNPTTQSDYVCSGFGQQR
jgi:hypothetical protein